MKRLAAFVLDGALVTAFIWISRVTHDSSLAADKLWQALWPFLVGLLLGWLVTRAWRNPLTEVAFLGAWAGTVAAGFTYRYLTRPLPKVADVVVATLVLGFLFGGWRLMAFLFASLRRRRRLGLPVD